MSRVGVFGGTFDPPHVGHLTVARDLRDVLDLDELLLVPAARPPHKAEEGTTEPALRLAMLRAAVRGVAGLRVSEVELRRGGTSYTIDTLRELKDSRPDDELFLVMGVDQFNALASWKEPEEIARLATVVVMAREGETPPEIAPGTDIRGRQAPVTRVDVSSTAVREAVARGEPVDDLVPEPVLEVIRARGLYRD